MRRVPRLLTLIVWTLLCVAGSALAKDRGPTEKDISRWAAMVPKTPRGVGRTIEDREAWQAIARLPGFANAVSHAEELVSQPIPELTDDLYLEFRALATGRTASGCKVSAMDGSVHWCWPNASRTKGVFYQPSRKPSARFAARSRGSFQPMTTGWPTSKEQDTPSNWAWSQFLGIWLLHATGWAID